jgi:transposase
MLRTEMEDFCHELSKGYVEVCHNAFSDRAPSSAVAAPKPPPAGDGLELWKIAVFNDYDVIAEYRSCENETQMSKGKRKIGDGARIDVPASDCALESNGLPAPVKDKRGLRHGRLVVQEFAGFQVSGKKRSSIWLCVCDCGNTICVGGVPHCTVYSCGCLFHELRTTHGIKALKDGEKSAEFPVYAAWYAQLRNCYSPKSARYSTVGGRGIKMCDRWVNDFPAFLEDVGYPPTPDHVLARIDYDKDYEPSNVRWIPKTEHTEKSIAHSLQQRYKDKPKPSDEQLTLLAQKYPNSSLAEYCELFAKETGTPISLGIMARSLRKLGLSHKKQKLSDDQLILFAQQYPDANVTEYCELIAKETGIRISKTNVSIRLQKLGLSRKEQRHARFK